MKKKHPVRSSQGSGLIEILIATAAVGFVLTAIAATLMMSVKTASESKYRSIAEQKASEAMEVFKRERVLLGWSSFIGSLETDDYCFVALPAPTSPFSSFRGSCVPGDTFVVAKTDFTRWAEVTVIPNTVTVKMVVSWPMGTTTNSVDIVQQFKKW